MDKYTYKLGPFSPKVLLRFQQIKTLIKFGHCDCNFDEKMFIKYKDGHQ